MYIPKGIITQDQHSMKSHSSLVYQENKDNSCKDALIKLLDYGFEFAGATFGENGKHAGFFYMPGIILELDLEPLHDEFYVKLSCSIVLFEGGESPFMLRESQPSFSDFPIASHNSRERKNAFEILNMVSIIEHYGVIMPFAIHSNILEDICESRWTSDVKISDDDLIKNLMEQDYPDEFKQMVIDFSLKTPVSQKIKFGLA